MKLLAALLFVPLVAFANPAAVHLQQQKQAEERELTSTARLLAGKSSEHKPHAFVMEMDAWKTHAAATQPRWTRLQKERLAKMEAWRDLELGEERDSCKTLLYPFSGPDFLNAYLLFPTCNEYVFFGLELPGSPPDLDKLPRKELGNLFHDARVAMADLLEFNYFITSRMSTQLHTPHLKGATPIMMSMMGFLNVTVHSVTKIVFPARGVMIEFTHPMVGKRQRLLYFSLDATDKALHKEPNFVPYLEKKQGYTLLKSASYLFHGEEFSIIRKTILKNTQVLVQDDTGFPVRLLTDFTVILFGKYNKPIPVFKGYGYQPILEKLYANNKTDPLPFSFGYHWKPETSGLLIARRLP